MTKRGPKIWSVPSWKSLAFRNEPKPAENNRRAITELSEACLGHHQGIGVGLRAGKSPRPSKHRHLSVSSQVWYYIKQPSHSEKWEKWQIHVKYASKATRIFHVTATVTFPPSWLHRRANTAAWHQEPRREGWGQHSCPVGHTVCLFLTSLNAKSHQQYLLWRRGMENSVAPHGSGSTSPTVSQGASSTG